MSGLVEAGRYTNSWDAGVARSLLEAEGIHGVLFDHNYSGVEGVPHLIPVRLMVLGEDLDEARALLDVGKLHEEDVERPVRLRARRGAWLAMFAMFWPWLLWPFW